MCERGSLYQLLHDPQLHLSWPTVLGMALDVARGCRHLHASHILHRDLKSGNLLVTAEWRILIADFGLSRVISRHQTMTGGLGTYQWMAPEVLARQRYSEKADIYSFSIVLWEMAARRLPYEGLNGFEAALAVMTRGLRPPIPPETPPLLAALIRACVRGSGALGAPALTDASG